MRGRHRAGIRWRFTTARSGRTSPAVGLAPGRKILWRLLVGCGVEAEDGAAAANLLGDEILERGHLDRLVGDLVGEVRGDHDDAVAVAEDDIAGKPWRVAAADRDVDLDGLVQREVGRRAGAVVIGREAESRDLGR